MSSHPNHTEIQPLPSESRWDAITRERKQRMTAVQITGLTRVARPKPNTGGSTILAYFDCEVRGFRLIGCAFVRTPRNGLTVWLPKLEAPEVRARSITITDDSIRHAMMLHARETYRALGGDDAEWIGKAIPEGPRVAEPHHMVSFAAEDPTLERAEPEDLDTSGVARFLGAETRAALG